MIDQNGNKNFFQIYITDDDSIELPPLISHCVSHVKFWASGYSHFIFNGKSVRDAIAENLPIEVLQAYDALKPYAYKADLGRICLLYLYGGWYLDITCKLARPLPDVDALSHVLFSAPFGPGHSSWDLQNSMLFASKGSKLLEAAINRIVENCKNKWYGQNALCPTGPSLLGSVYAMWGMTPDIMTCEYRPLTPDYHKKNYAFILNSGEILAWGKETGGTAEGNGLYAYGASNTNSYSKIYNDKNIYHELEYGTEKFR